MAPAETRIKRGGLRSFHLEIRFPPGVPALQCGAPVPVEHLGPDSQQKVGAPFGPTHLLFVDEPLIPILGQRDYLRRAGNLSDGPRIGVKRDANDLHLGGRRPTLKSFRPERAV